MNRGKWIGGFLCTIVAGVAGMLYARTAILPQIIAPCHGYLPGDPLRMAVSWSLIHPVMAGFWSALSFGWWPAHGYFAMPEYCTAGDYGHGIPMHWYMAVARNAFPAFQWSRGIFSGLLWGALSCVGYRFWRRWQRHLDVRSSHPVIPS
ncbi:hypothetical protein JKG47_20475 [Acidithiobacillus sp. MC6.1]|nr:hypothetical protein [Acidithiobacillus sp. MC6.1]